MHQERKSATHLPIGIEVECLLLLHLADGKVVEQNPSRLGFVIVRNWMRVHIRAIILDQERILTSYKGDEMSLLSPFWLDGNDDGLCQT